MAEALRCLQYSAKTFSQALYPGVSLEFPQTGINRRRPGRVLPARPRRGIPFLSTHAANFDYHEFGAEIFA